MRSHILGHWLELGHENWYLTKKSVQSLDDFNGLKIRSPGGAGISWRIAFVHAIPNVTPWPNVPLALSQGTFDGFVSSDESCTSAKLWEAGVKYSYADHQFFANYIPMLSDAFWSKLNDADRKLMRDLWAANVDRYRAMSAKSQADARETMKSHGVSLRRSARGAVCRRPQADDRRAGRPDPRRQTLARHRQARHRGRRKQRLTRAARSENCSCATRCGTRPNGS